MKWIQTTILALSLINFIGCASNPISEFPKIKRGMEKTDVVEILDSPYRVFRVNDTDVWVYRFRKEDTWESREIHFRDGVVQFAGSPLTREKLTEGIVPPPKSQ